VPYGFFYDEPRLQNLPEGSGYGGYRGSGFQFLIKPRTVAQAPEVYRAEWRWTRDETPGHLALWAVGEGESAIQCMGRPQNRKELPEEVPFLIRRRTAMSDGALESVFASVFEPFAESPRIRSVARVALTPAATGATALRVTLPERSDLFVFGAGEAGVTTADGARFRGDFAYLSLDGAGRVRAAYAADGGSIARGDFRLGAAERPAAVRVASADWERHTVTLDAPIPAGVAPGQIVMFGHGRHAYTIEGVDRAARRIDLGDQDCVVARGVVDRAEAGGGGTVLRTGTSIPYARAGMHVLDVTRQASWRLRAVQDGRLTLGGEGAWPAASQRFFVVDYGPGDAVVLSAPAVYPAPER